MNLIYYDLKNSTGIDPEELKKKSIRELVKQVILPQIAGIPDAEKTISEDYMQFLTAYGKELYSKDQTTGLILYQLALYRLLNCGFTDTNLHVIQTAYANIPLEFLPYFPKNIHQEHLHKTDEEFLLRELENCMQYNDNLKQIGLEIAFGLSCHISPNGLPHKGYQTDEDVSCLNLLKASEQIIAKYGTEKECLKRWQTPTLWLEHFDFFADLHKKGKLDRSSFLAKVQRYESPSQIYQKHTLVSAIFHFNDMLTFWDEEHDIMKALDDNNPNYPFATSLDRYK